MDSTYSPRTTFSHNGVSYTLERISAVMTELSLSMFDAIRRFINGRGIIGTRETTLNALARRGLVQRFRWIKRTERGEIYADHTGWELTSLGYQIAYESGYMGSYNAYADELARKYEAATLALGTPVRITTLGIDGVISDIGVCAADRYRVTWFNRNFWRVDHKWVSRDALFIYPK